MSENGKREIRILGAGPSGLTAAINLARAGHPVTVFERRKNTGMRFHGDIQGLENWSESRNVVAELEEMGLCVNFDCDPFHKLVITNGARERVSHYPPERPLCYLVKRGPAPGTLDQGLKAQAEEAGVEIRFGETIPRDKADIIATGPISRETFAVDKGIVFETDYEDTNVFLVNDDAAYKGYSYLLITKGYGCMCTVLFERFPEVDACFETSEKMFRQMYDFDIRNRTPVSGVGCFSTRNIFREGRGLVVGEAAGIQDLLWGFGIRTAVKSGYLAARCIIEGRDYEQAARSMFQDKLKATLVSRYIWELIRFNNYALVVNQRVNNKSARKAFDLSSMYNFGTLLKLIYPVARLSVRRRYPNLRV